jgi:Trypsin-co-occurring domain 2
MASGVGLAEAIQSLRRELQEAVETGRGEALRFRLSPIELTLQVAVTKDANGKVSGWWIVEVGGSVESAHTQTLKVTLEPGWLQPDGSYLDTGQWTVASESPEGGEPSTFGPEDD